MKKRTLVLLQDNITLNEQMKNQFEESGDFEVVGTSGDGLEGLEIIKQTNPDYVVTELILTGIDGLCVIDKMKMAGITSKIIVVSAISREEVISSAINKGANYFMAKPLSFEILKERMLELDGVMTTPSRQTEVVPRKINLDEKISKIFINAGIPPHIKGYCYLREGVKMAIANPDIINNITKKLYPMIGEKYNTTASKVERAIRHAIEVAWNRGRIENINNIMGVRAYVGSEKPTNAEFIALVADKMLFEGA